MSYKIVTHDGKAHMDELLASALLALHMGEEPDEIIRMEPRDAEALVTSGEREDNMWFLDCSMGFDPSEGLFDHHQDRDLDCSALLIFNTYFPHLAGTELHDYIRLVSKVDTKGIMSLDDFHLVSESSEYYSFSQQILLRTFEETPLVALKLVLEGLEDKIAFEKAKQVAGLWRREPGNLEIIQVEDVKVLVYRRQPPPELVSPLRSEVSRLVEENGICATLSFDSKVPDARTLYRTDFGHNTMDFTESRPSKTLFCHNGGFLLKFVPSDDGEWKRLVAEAIVA